MDNSLKEYVFKMKDKLMLFHLLNDEEVSQVVDYFSIVQYRKGSVIFKEGDRGEFMGFILSGVLEVKKQTQFKGKEIVLATLKKGSFVGEISLVSDNDLRTATVVALEDTDMVVLTRTALDRLLETYPETGIKILKGLIQILTIRLRKTVERLTSIF